MLMRNLFNIIFLGVIAIIAEAQTTHDFQKSYETNFGYNFIVTRDTFQTKQQWESSICYNLGRLNRQNNPPAYHYYRLAVNYSMLNNTDSAHYFLKEYIRFSDDDVCVLIDPLFDNLRTDEIKWQDITKSIDSLYLLCLNNVANEEYALELFHLNPLDQKYRYYYPRWGVWEYSRAYNQDSLNAETLKTLIKKYGFPTISKVGNYAAETAFLVIQHNPSLKKYYHQLFKAYRNNDFDSWCYARAKDRYLTLYLGRKQLYGTSWVHSTKTQKKYGDKYVLRPVRNFKNLNKRRASIGLKPIEETIEEDSVIPEKYYKRCKKY